MKLPRSLLAAAVVGLSASAVYFAGEAQFRSAIMAPLVDMAAVAAFPGTIASFVVDRIFGGVTSPIAAFVVSSIFNTAFYWALFAVVGLGVRSWAGGPQH